jgi:phage terminase small subunit
MKPKNQKLTMKQAVFVEQFLLDSNASAAARRAGYSVKNAGRIAGELMEKTHIAAAVAEAQAKRSVRTGITVDEVLRNIIRIGRQAEAEGKYGEALRAQELLGRHLAMFTDRVETPGAPDSITIHYRRARPEEA